MRQRWLEEMITRSWLGSSTLLVMQTSMPKRTSAYMSFTVIFSVDSNIHRSDDVNLSQAPVTRSTTRRYKLYLVKKASAMATCTAA